MSVGEAIPKTTYRTIVDDSGDPGYVNRLLVATPTTGLVRMEWAAARYGQVVPMNWSMVTMLQFMSGYVPQRYQVDDAQNLIVREVIDKDFQWLLLVEHDVILPPDAFVRFNQYIRDADIPIVSGLYYSRSRPSEPLVFRGRGTSVYMDWKQGDRVWVDGVPTGCLLIHAGILRAMWNDAEEYTIPYGGRNQVTKRVFNTPRDIWLDPESEQFNTKSGTSDLDWCTKVIDGKYLEKAGWGKYQAMEYPFLIDTAIFCVHMDPDGARYP